MKAASLIGLLGAVVLTLTPVAEADSITFLGLEYNEGDGDYTWHYRYDRTDTLVANTSTWTLNGTRDVAIATGCTYWSDYANLGPGGTWVEWTYTGGDDPQLNSYGTFDIRATGRSTLVPYDVDTDGDGGVDYTGYVDGPVPEPATCGLMIAGLAAVGMVFRRRSA